MTPLSALRPTPRLIPPDVLQSQIASAFNSASNSLANERRNAAVALAALRKSVREGAVPKSLTAAFSTATDTLACAVAVELAHVKVWLSAWQEMEAELLDLARRADSDLSAAKTAAAEAFIASGTDAELQGAWLLRSSNPAAGALRERVSFRTAVTEAMHPLQADNRKRRYQDDGGPQVIAGLEQALLQMAGSD